MLLCYFLFFLLIFLHYVGHKFFHFSILLCTKCMSVFILFCCSLVAKSYLTLCNPMDCTKLSCPSLSPRVFSNSCALILWCHLTISPSVALFCSCPQSFSASGSSPVSWPFISDGQSIGASASASILPMIIQGWFQLGLTSLISLHPRNSKSLLQHRFSFYSNCS